MTVKTFEVYVGTFSIAIAGREGDGELMDGKTGFEELLVYLPPYFKAALRDAGTDDGTTLLRVGTEGFHKGRNGFLDYALVGSSPSCMNSSGSMVGRIVDDDGDAICGAYAETGVGQCADNGIDAFHLCFLFFLAEREELFGDMEYAVLVSLMGTGKTQVVSFVQEGKEKAWIATYGSVGGERRYSI